MSFFFIFFVFPAQDQTMMSGSLVKLNVGGEIFTTRRQTLLSCGSKFFRFLLESETPEKLDRDEQGNLFVDRSPQFFARILQILRQGGVSMISDDDSELKNELEFYDIPFALPGSEDQKNVTQFPFEVPEATKPMIECLEKQPFDSIISLALFIQDFSPGDDRHETVISLCTPSQRIDHFEDVVNLWENESRFLLLLSWLEFHHWVRQPDIPWSSDPRSNHTHLGVHVMVHFRKERITQSLFQ